MLAVDAIARLSRIYAHCADSCDVSALADVFSEDALLSVSSRENRHDKRYEFSGLQNITSGLQGIDIYPATIHMLGQQLLLTYDADNASTETYCRASHFYRRDGIESEYVMYIRYIDDIQKVGMNWKLVTRGAIVDAETGNPLQQVSH